jgi:hypothetical protein
MIIVSALASSEGSYLRGHGHGSGAMRKHQHHQQGSPRDYALPCSSKYTLQNKMRGGFCRFWGFHKDGFARGSEPCVRAVTHHNHKRARARCRLEAGAKRIHIYQCATLGWMSFSFSCVSPNTPHPYTDRHTRRVPRKTGTS